MSDTLSISVGKEKRKKERKINKNDFSNQLLFVYMTKSYTRYIFQQRINNIERNKTSMRNERYANETPLNTRIRRSIYNTFMCFEFRFPMEIRVNYNR